MSNATAIEPQKETQLTRSKGYRGNVATARGWRSRFIKALRDLPNVTHACQLARVSRVRAYEERNNNSDFKAQWDDALAFGIGSLEKVMLDHSKYGVPYGVWMRDKNGNPKKVETRRDFPYGMASILLKAHMPEKYAVQRDTLSLGTQTTAPDGTKTEFVVHLSAEELP